MTLIAAVRLSMDLLLSASNAVVAAVLLKETGWRSLVPPLLMSMLVARADGVKSPQPALLAVAVAACVLLLWARDPRLRLLRLGAVIACSLTTAAVQVLARL